MTRDFFATRIREAWTLSASKGMAAVQRRDALTELVRQQVGEGRRYSTREFEKIAVDPDTGYTVGKSLSGKIINGQGYKITPSLVSALGAGLQLPREIVAAAAHWQVIGYRSEELQDGAPAVLLRLVDATEPPGPLSQAVADRWAAEEGGSFE